MLTNTKKVLLYGLLLVMMVSAAQAQKKSKRVRPEESGYTEYEVQFLKTGVEGTIFFKIYSYGDNENECIENAKRNAVRAVIFSGIPGSDLEDPLTSETGAEIKYKDYFDIFFNKKGKYINYVSISNDGSINSNDRYRVGKQIKVGINVVVRKAQLRKELQAAGIIKDLGDYF